ncbi:TetR/AcrR family transcriptional regulator C-terminal domain-containing protein [Streptomyces albofaciens]|uniref:TetR/AcrR family transcriptional regulator C-terminal domain-containing protein n=1 Tax=Streptomyces albofaciens TaxID=66866 RepID=UPI001FCB3839|nr:TetR/AcrR family transcriptional regulator C-terminal domain-containing protein [Streptomyces albofaciens]
MEETLEGVKEPPEGMEAVLDNPKESSTGVMTGLFHSTRPGCTAFAARSAGAETAARPWGVAGRRYDEAPRTGEPQGFVATSVHVFRCYVLSGATVLFCGVHFRRCLAAENVAGTARLDDAETAATQFRGDLISDYVFWPWMLLVRCPPLSRATL